MQKLYDLANQAFGLRSEYSNSKLVRKVLRSLPDWFNIKVTALKESKDIYATRIDELIRSLQTFEINREEAKKGKSKSEKNISLFSARNSAHLTKHCYRGDVRTIGFAYSRVQQDGQEAVWKE